VDGQVTELLPRVSFGDMTRWPGWELADPDEGDETWVSVVLPTGWSAYMTTGETPVKVLRDAYLRPRFAVLATGLVVIDEEAAGRY